MQQEIARYAAVVSSTLLQIEALQAARRHGPESEHFAREALRSVSLLPMDSAVVDVAAEIALPGLRSLDAIHLATAFSLEDTLAVFISYDERQLQAAEEMGGFVAFPGRN